MSTDSPSTTDATFKETAEDLNTATGVQGNVNGSTTDHLAEIKARAKNRIPGHWHAVSIEFRGQTSHSVKSNVGSVLAHTGYGPVGGSSHANAEFMANAPADIEFLLSLVDSLQERLDTAEGRTRTAEKELAAAHFALNVDGWRVEADEDGTVDLYHEFSDFPMLSDVRDLGAILAFIAESNEGADTAKALGLDGSGVSQ